LSNINKTFEGKEVNCALFVSEKCAYFILLLFVMIAIPIVISGVATYKRNFIWKGEITLWEDVVRKTPKKAMGYNNLGVAYKKAELLDKALREYRKALKLQPDYPEAHYNLANIYNIKGHLQEAIDEYSKALRLKPDYAEVYNNLGIVYGKKGWFDMAIEEFKRALVFEPHYIDARYNLALTYPIFS